MITSQDRIRELTTRQMYVDSSLIVIGIFMSWVLWNYTNHPVVLLIVGLCTLPVAFLHGKELSNDISDRKSTE